MDEIDLGEVSRRLAREGAQRGDVQVSLAWNTLDDLDIRVVTPSGETISYQNKQSRCGGHLDVDMNANGRCSIAPVENVYWSRAPSGEYRVLVHLQGDLHRLNMSVREPEAGAKLATDSVFVCK